MRKTEYRKKKLEVCIYISLVQLGATIYYFTHMSYMYTEIYIGLDLNPTGFKINPNQNMVMISYSIKCQIYIINYIFVLIDFKTAQFLG